MSVIGRTRILRLMVLVGTVGASAGVVILVVTGEWGVSDLAVLGGVASMAFVVWLLASTQPENRLTWVLAVFVLFVGMYPLGTGINALLWPGAEMPLYFGDPIPDDLPIGFLTVNGLAEALGSAGLFLLLTYGLLLFPDGHIPSRRWRWVARLAGLAVCLFFLISVYTAMPGNADFMRESALAEWSYMLLALSVPPCLIGLIVRFRRSAGDIRQQFKWILWGAVVLVATNLVSFLGGPQNIGVVGIIVFAATYAIAILKYRLYDIDVVISRTVVLAVLAGFITLVYALIVVGLGNALSGDADGLLFPILATAIVAVAFEPVRNQAQGWANRLVYGQRATPYEVLSDLTGRLSHGEEGEGLLVRMAKRLGDGTGADRATIWLGGGGEMVVGSSWPIDPEPGHRIDLTADDVFPVTHDGLVVGALEVIKPRGSALSSAERSLIDDLAGSAGAVLGYQRLNDSLQEKAAELARSRSRLVEAQDRERRRLERDLHDGAQQLIVALKVKIGLARSMAAGSNATELESLLGGLGDEAQAALDEVRALAKGIYPPVLESDGLASAISALAAGAAEEVVVSCDGVGRYERDVETAVYFEVSEAVTNAIKHASGPILVALDGTSDSLRFSVSDSGPGFDPSQANGGSGLQNLKDRMDSVGGILEIDSSPEAGTTVRGEIPLVMAGV